MRVQMRAKSGHKGRELTIQGKNGNEFRLILRQAAENPLDFSIILGVTSPNTGQLFRLRRYNGKSHEHGNKIEGNSFYDFHIHEATERYQQLGANEDTFARKTDRYSDYRTALECLIRDCGFELPDGEQGSLF